MNLYLVWYCKWEACIMCFMACVCMSEYKSWLCNTINHYFFSHVGGQLLCSLWQLWWAVLLQVFYYTGCVILEHHKGLFTKSNFETKLGELTQISMNLHIIVLFCCPLSFALLYWNLQVNTAIFWWVSSSFSITYMHLLHQIQEGWNEARGQL